MGRTRRRVVSLLLSSSMVLALPGSASAAPSNADRATLAGSYIALRQRADGSIPAFSPIGSTADAVLAFVAEGAGTTPLASAMGYLRRQTAKGNLTTIGLRAKVALAVQAGGRNPQNFGGHNLIDEISQSKRLTGRYANASVLDEALGILAIYASFGASDLDAIRWLMRAQCPDGGWQYDRPYASKTEGAHCGNTADPLADPFRSDTNTTAYAVMALSIPKGGWKHDPFAYLASMRDAAHGGWGYTFGYETTDANSTALVIQAYAAQAQPPPAGARAALRKLQYGCGAFAYSWTDAGKRTGPDVGATIGAVPGLLALPLPLAGTVTGELPASTCPA